MMRRDRFTQQAQEVSAARRKRPACRRQGGRAGPFAGEGHRGGGAEGAERGENDAKTQNRAWK